MVGPPPLPILPHSPELVKSSRLTIFSPAWALASWRGLGSPWLAPLHPHPRALPSFLPPDSKGLLPRTLPQPLLDTLQPAPPAQAGASVQRQELPS